MKEYGPSNWEKRPSVTRRGEDIVPPSISNDGKMAEVIWTSRSLMEEQAGRALENGELTADAILGLYWKITDPRINTDTDELKRVVLANAELIEYACVEFEKIPADFIAKEGNSHRTTIAANNPEEFTDIIRTTLEFLRKGAEMDDDTAFLRDVLSITAQYLDKKQRGTLI